VLSQVILSVDKIVNREVRRVEIRFKRVLIWLLLSLFIPIRIECFTLLVLSLHFLYYLWSMGNIMQYKLAKINQDFFGVTSKTGPVMSSGKS
jgi:hypothetical protein